MAISSSQQAAIKSQLNKGVKPLVVPYYGIINAMPISSSLKTHIKNYPVSYFLDSWMKNILGSSATRSLLASMVKATGRKSASAGGKTFRVAYRSGDPIMLNRLQLLFMIGKYPRTAASVFKKRAGLGATGVGNYCGAGGLGCFDPITITLCLTVVSIIGSVGLLVLVGPAIWDFISQMTGMAPAPTTTAPSDTGPAFGPAAMLPGGSGPAFGPAFGPSFDTTTATPGESGMQPYVSDEGGPPIALIVGGTAVAGLAAWFLLGKKKKRR